MSQWENQMSQPVQRRSLKIFYRSKGMLDAQTEVELAFSTVGQECQLNFS